MKTLLCRLRSDNRGQDVAEYAFMLAVLLVLIVATITTIGTNAGNVFTSTGDALK